MCWFSLKWTAGALSVSEYSAVFGGPVCNRSIQLRLAIRKRLKLQRGSKRRSGWWSHSPQGALGAGRRGVKAGLKAEADPQIGKTNWLRKKIEFTRGQARQERACNGI